MKRLAYLLIPAVIFASCGGSKTADTAKDGTKKTDSSKKAIPVTVQEIQPTNFVATINVQSQITGDQNVYATPQVAGVANNITAHVGQHVTKGQVLGTLNSANVQQQIEAQDVQLTLVKSLYEKQQALWAENIGTEVQLLTAKANYESAIKQRGALVAQRDMYSIKSPITGTVDMVSLKEGDATQPGAQNIRIVTTNELKAEANLGENYLGKVHQGNPVTLIFPDLGDSIKTSLTYVAQGVDPISRAFTVQVKLNSNAKLHPNMSAIMKIANYQSSNTLVIPVNIIQKTGKGEMIFIADGNKAKAVQITTGQNSNGQVEVLSGLSAGDKILTSGFEDLDNGDPIIAQ